MPGPKPVRHGFTSATGWSCTKEEFEYGNVTWIVVININFIILTIGHSGKSEPELKELRGKAEKYLLRAEQIKKIVKSGGGEDFNYLQL